MKRTRSRKCRHCCVLFTPDYRNGSHQHYCQKPACNAASKRASQKRCLGKPQNRDYHRDSAHKNTIHGDRVRAWRKAHPRYWRREAVALQDDCSAKTMATVEETHVLNQPVTTENAPLQDHCLAQDPLFVGFFAHITGALQDDMAFQIARFQTHGQQILRKGPGIETERSLR